MLRLHPDLVEVVVVEGFGVAVAVLEVVEEAIKLMKISNYKFKKKLKNIKRVYKAQNGGYSIKTRGCKEES
jgi:hypothetical protein